MSYRVHSKLSARGFLHSTAFGAILFTALVSGSCGDGSGAGTGPDPDDAIASVVVSPLQATVAVGATVQLSVTVLNGHGESLHTAVAWTSSAVSVASVDDNGLVSGLSVGVATVTASAGGVSSSSVVTVTDPVTPENLRWTSA